jgi:hypothetical protein
VALYLEPIVAALANGASPQQVCTNLALCSSEDKPQGVSDRKQRPEKPNTKPDHEKPKGDKKQHHE